MFDKKTIRDIDVSGQTVLVRTDYNLPLTNGSITNDYRIIKSIPTIQYLLERGCRVVICSHLGRPKGVVDPGLSLRPIGDIVSKLLKCPVDFSSDCVGPERDQKVAALQPGGVLLLENLRFHAEEKANDDDFARKLAGGIDLFVQDGFGVAHRADASTEAITRHLPAVAGLLLETEVLVIQQVMEKPKRPLMALIGGAKISDKIDILNRFIDVADVVAIGGAMSNTFLLAEGVHIGKSLAQPDEINLARDIMDTARGKVKNSDFVFYLPQDGVVAKEMTSQAHTHIVDWGTHMIADIESYPKAPPILGSHVADDEAILDIGPFSAAFISGCMQLAGTVIWNGSMGVTEVKGVNSSTGPFAHGTEQMVEAMLGQFGHRPHTMVGGGDTVGYIESQNLVDKFDHVSTGGGASLELMSGKKLPGIEALQDK